MSNSSPPFPRNVAGNAQEEVGRRRRARKTKADGKVRDVKLTEEEKELLRQVKNENATVSTVVVPPSRRSDDRLNVPMLPPNR